MRRVLLLSVALLASQPAFADLPTIDAANAVAQARNLLQSIKTYGTQLQQYATQLRELQQDVQIATTTATTLQALAHNPNLGQVMGLANLLGLSPSLPINPYSVQGLVSGYGGMNSVGGLVGRLNSLGSLVNGSYNNDRIYSCNSTSFACQQSQQWAASNAGIKGTVGQIYADMVGHTPVLQGIRDRLATANTPKDVQDAQAQIALEQAWAANEQGQLQTVVALAEVQRGVREEQANEKLTSDIDAVLAAAPK